MLCHCGLEAAAVLRFLLMSIGSAVSLLPDDGHNATVLCFWPQNKAPPPRVQFLTQVQPFWCRPPGRVNPLASAHLGAEGVRIWPQPVGTPAVLG